MVLIILRSTFLVKEGESMKANNVLIVLIVVTLLILYNSGDVKKELKQGQIKL